ncbi:IS3 family transposase [Paenibacillus caseinilyticus]|uniref:Transposase n=1 Tax=Paenibacillus mucilaginosus K02 TaxID=997761 RepID=I0BD62_9BACL|nr:IS3 family transposase [Paenibacillus mucilaginosus]AFH60309.2 transposase [Paenibacillus mucilaginosus K02]
MNKTTLMKWQRRYKLYGYLHTYQTFEELKRDILAYIDFYNNERLQAKLNGLSPMEYRTKAA